MEDSKHTSPKKSDERVDTATSTPGPQVHPSLARNRDSMESPPRIVRSELTESDESAVISTPGNSTMEQTTVYEKPEDDTTIQNQTSEGSCIAYRTRSKSVSAEVSEIVFNLHELMSAVEKEKSPSKDQE